MKLDKAECGKTYRILSVNAPPALAERLRMLNVAEGCTVRLLRRALVDLPRLVLQAIHDPSFP